MVIVIGGLAARCDATAVALSGLLTLPDSPPPLGPGSVSLPLNKAGVALAEVRFGAHLRTQVGHRAESEMWLIGDSGFEMKEAAN